MLEPVVKTIEVACNQEKAFDIFVNQTNAWWPMDKNSVSAMGGNVAKDVRIEAREGGRIVEIGHDDTEHLWGSVSTYQPSSLFIMNWHIGLPADNPSTVKVEFNEVGDSRTQVVLTHSNWESFAEKAEDMRKGYNAGWVGVFENAYKQCCDSHS